MNVSKAVEERRAYRSLKPVKITEEIVEDLALSAGLAPSCYNHQPWRFDFVYGEEKLREMFSALSKGNNWAEKSSMIIAVYSRKDLDCVIKDREYFLFDTGMATAFLILKATEMGLVAHPIAGFSPKKVREILQVPDDMHIITLVIVGAKDEEISPLLSEKMAETELKRPERMQISRFVRFF